MGRKLINIRKPRLRISKKGIGITPPSARIGGKVGINISKRGVSGSVRTKYGTANTRNGCSLAPCLLVAICLTGMPLVVGIGVIVALI